VTARSLSRARLPSAPLSPRDLEERDRFARLTAGSLATVRASAQTWRNGLAAFITLVTTGIVIKGRDTTTDLPTGWRVLITVLIGGGLALAVIGLWQALAAEAGTDPKTQTLEDIRATHGSLDAYQVTLAANAAHRLQWGRRAVAAALIFFLAGIAVTWWAPSAVPSPPAYITVTYGHAVTCGTPVTGSRGQLRVIPYGSRRPITVSFSQITSLTDTASCS
jgi:hypothetical protein